MEQAHTSDTLDIDFLKPQQSYILSPQTISKIYSCQQEQLLLQNIMSMVNIDKPLILYQLLEQMENQHTKVLLKKGEIHSSQISYQNNTQQVQSQECIRVNSQKQNRNTECLNGIKNIYQQHSYHTHILPNLSGLYSEQVEIQGQSQRKQQLKGQKYLGKHSLVQHSDHLLSQKKQRQIQKGIEIEENQINTRNNTKNNANNNTNNNIDNFSQQLQIVSQSVQSVQSLITKISLFRYHSVLIREKIKQKKFNIDKLHVIKNNKKQYLTHLVNVQTIMRNKILPLSIKMVNSLCSQHAIDNTEYDPNIQQQKLLLVQQLIMKYQYSPYVFLNKTLYNKLYDVICYRIENKLQVRLMNLNGNKLIQLLQIYLPKLIVSIQSRRQKYHDKREGNSKRSDQQQQKQRQRQLTLTLTQLTKNLLNIVIYLKPDSYQCIDTKSSSYLHSQYQDILQQSYITASLNNDLTSLIQVDEFIKVGSMMQFSSTTRQIYASLKYTWFSLYKLGLKHTLSVFSAILVQQQQTICQQSLLSLPKDKINHNHLFKQNDYRKIKTVTLSTNINLNQRYGNIGHTLQSITQLFKRFQPKYNWVYQYVVNKNVSLKKYSINQFESLSLYLVDSLFKIVDKYQKDTQNKMFNRLVCQKVFGKLNKNRKIIENVSEQSLQIKDIGKQQSDRIGFIQILKKAIQQKQIQKHNHDNKSNKDKKKQQQKSKQIKKQIKQTKNNKIYNNKRQSVFMVIDDDYDNDEQLLSVQFEIIQKTEMKKMLIFQSEILKGLSQDNRMEIVQKDLVHMIERVNVLGVNLKDNRDNNNEINLANANNETFRVIKQLIQIYQSYGQECYQTDEVKQFQTVLLKLIMQGLIKNDENNKDNNNKDIHNMKSLRYYNRLEQINNNIKANQSRINTLKLILTNNNVSNCQHKNHNQYHSHSLIINQINQLQQQVIYSHNYHQNQKLQKQKQQSFLVQKSKQSPKKKKSLFSSNKDNHNKDSDKKKQPIMQDTKKEESYNKQNSILLLTKIRTTLAACVHSLIAIIKQQKTKQQKDILNNSYQERVFMSSVIIKLLAIVEIIQSLCYYTHCSNINKSPQNNNNKNSKFSQNNNKPLNDNNNNTHNLKLMVTTKNESFNEQGITNDNTLLIPIDENDLNKIISLMREHYQSTSSQSSSQLFKQLFYGVSNMINNTFSIDFNSSVNSNKRGIKSESNLLSYQYQQTQYRNNSFTQLQRNNSFTQLQKQITNTNDNTNTKKNTNNTKTKKESKISSFIGSVFGKINKKKSIQQNQFTQQNHTHTNTKQQQQLKEEQTKSKRQQQQYLQKVQNKRKSSLQQQLSQLSSQNMYQFQKPFVNNNNNNNMNRKLHKQSKQIQLKTFLILIYQMTRK